MSSTETNTTDAGEQLDETREESLECLAESDLPIADDAARVLAALREERGHGGSS